MKKQHALLRTISFKPSNFHFKVASATMDVWNGGGHFIFVATLTSLKQIICSHMSRNVQGNVGNELFDSYHHRKTSRPDHKSGHERHYQACSSYLIYWIDWLPLSPIITYFSPFPRHIDPCGIEASDVPDLCCSLTVFVGNNTLWKAQELNTATKNVPREHQKHGGGKKVFISSMIRLVEEERWGDSRWETGLRAEVKPAGGRGRGEARE